MLQYLRMATNFNELISLVRDSWRENAACREADTSAFFIGPGKSPDAALAVCNRCEVRDECLEFALDNEENYGIWGGLNADQRKKLRRRRNNEKPPPGPSGSRADAAPPDSAVLLPAAPSLQVA